MRLNSGRDDSIVAALDAGESGTVVAHRFGLSVAQVNRIGARDSAFRREGRGRPRAAESEVRQQELVRLIATGSSFSDAARQARVSAETVLGLLDRPDFGAFALSVINERIAA